MGRRYAEAFAHVLKGGSSRQNGSFVINTPPRTRPSLRKSEGRSPHEHGSGHFSDLRRRPLIPDTRNRTAHSLAVPDNLLYEVAEGGVVEKMDRRIR